MNNRELAERAVNSPGWRWLPGMRGLDHAYEVRIVSVLEDPEFGDDADVVGTPTTFVVDGDCLSDSEVVGYRSYKPPTGDWSTSTLPDLSDPVTIGGLLALVREKMPLATVHHSDRCSRTRQWQVWAYKEFDSTETPTLKVVVSFGSTEAEALVNALNLGDSENL